ncbi:hypothetical protein C8Q75DRAFT_749932 [Abortiporus biennis]|nr:hypothetical protein C8Q75DRAFT_749932 [Abortiporus biennis]
MGKLDARGGVDIAEIIVYLCFLATSIILVLRHGFTRKAGWLLILIFSLIRIIGSALHIAAETIDSNNINIQIAAGIFESAGVSPLLGATLGFLGTVTQGSLDRDPIIARVIRAMGLLTTVALVLSIVGGTQSGSTSSISDANEGNTLRHVSVILFLVLYILIVLLHGYFWRQRDLILKHRRQLLLGISLALPFLGIRVLYMILSAFSPNVIAVPGATQPSRNSLSKFNTFTGEWQINFVMAVLMEMIVIGVYTVVGIMTPLSQDFDFEEEGRNRYGGDGDGYHGDMELR